MASALQPYRFLIILFIAGCSNANPDLDHVPIPQEPFDSTDFKCTLTAEKSVYELGETPDLKVEIKNLTDSKVFLVGSLDGSQEKMRMPYCYFTIKKPKKDTLPNSLRCGNVNPLRRKDFVLVRPDETFDPYMYIDDYGFFGSKKIRRPENFKQAGEYQIQFHYSTNSDTIEDYMGTPSDVERDSLRDLFKRVPKIEISSNKIEIRIKE